jgi:hypothetical protein
MLAQRDLCIVNDNVHGSKVGLPCNSRGEEGRKDKSTTQECSLEHGCTMGGEYASVDGTHLPRPLMQRSWSNGWRRVA